MKTGLRDLHGLQDNIEGLASVRNK
jgi:hypothetical protein